MLFSSFHTSRYQGFTLIEMLVALAIGSGIALMAYQAMTGAINIERRVSELTEKTNNINRVWQLLGDDFQHGVARPWVDEFANNQPAMFGLLGDRLSQSSLASTDEDTYLLRFVRSGGKNFFQQPRSNLQVVGYRITLEETAQTNNSDDEQGNITLWRDYWRPVDAGGDPKVSSRRLLDNIKTVRFRYLSSESESVEEQAWINGWPESSSQNERLPVAVEVSIDLDGLGDVSRLFSLIEADQQ